jgi:hypothetical protein
MASLDALLHACRENTSVLVSLRFWLDDEREKIKERCIKEKNAETVLELQGAAAKLHEMATRISQMVKTK